MYKDKPFGTKGLSDKLYFFFGFNFGGRFRGDFLSGNFRVQNLFDFFLALQAGGRF